MPPTNQLYKHDLSPYPSQESLLEVDLDTNLENWCSVI